MGGWGVCNGVGISASDTRSVNARFSFTYTCTISRSLPLPLRTHTSQLTYLSTHAPVRIATGVSSGRPSSTSPTAKMWGTLVRSSSSTTNLPLFVVWTCV